MPRSSATHAALKRSRILRVILVVRRRARQKCLHPVLTVPLAAAFGFLPHFLDGRVVIDTNNYYPDRDGRIDVPEQRKTTTSEMVVSPLPQATIVKAFNAILAKICSILLR